MAVSRACSPPTLPLAAGTRAEHGRSHCCRCACPHPPGVAARQPLATPPSLVPIMNSLGPERAPELALLALAGQRQRFVQVPQPAIEALNDAARRLHEDPRPILPPQARRALARLARSAESLGPSIVQI